MMRNKAAQLFLTTMIAAVLGAASTAQAAAPASLGDRFTVAGNFAEAGGVAGGADGSFVVAYSLAPDSLSDAALFLRRYSAAGQPIGSPIPVIDAANPSATGYAIRIAKNANGLLSVVWKVRSGAIYARSFNADGTPRGAGFLVDSPASDQVTLGLPAVAVDAVGMTLVSWARAVAAVQQVGSSSRTDTTLLARRFGATGTAGIETEVDSVVTRDTRTLTQRNTYGTPTVAANTAGGFAVSWVSEQTLLTLASASAKYLLKLKAYDQNDTAQGFTSTIETGSGKFGADEAPIDPSLASSSAGYSLFWHDSALSLLRLDSRGKKIGSIVAVPSDCPYGFLTAGPIALSSAGAAVMTWSCLSTADNARVIRAYRYAASGAALGGFDVAVPARPGHDEFQEPSVAIDSAGNSVIVWNDFGDDGDPEIPRNTEVIFGQRFAGN